MSLSKFHHSRIILHLDNDSYEIQNLRRHANHDDPIVAIDVNGLVLSTTQAARDLGISRRSKLNVAWANRRFPELEILVVPNNKWGKPESQTKRLSSYRVMEIVMAFAKEKGGFKIEMNSLDDMFIDVTRVAHDLARSCNDLDDLGVARLKNMYLENLAGTLGIDYIRSQIEESRVLSEELHLIMGAVLAQELAHEIIYKTGFKVSFGISTNKTLAKIATTLHRPRGITILTKEALPRVAQYVSVTKITGMGSESGERVLDMFGDGLTIAGLRKISIKKLAQCVGYEHAKLVKDRAHGNDDDDVEHKTMSKGMSCRKTLKKLDNDSDFLEEEITNLCEEMIERNFKEERVYHQRLGTRFKMEVESWYDCHPNYSFSFELDADEFKGMDEDDIAEIVIEGLKDDGFHFGRFYARKLTFSVTKWTGIPVHWYR